MAITSEEQRTLLRAISHERAALERELRAIIAESLESIPADLRTKPLKHVIVRIYQEKDDHYDHDHNHNHHNHLPRRGGGGSKAPNSRRKGLVELPKPVRLESGVMDGGRRRITRAMASKLEEAETPLTKRPKMMSLVGEEGKRRTTTTRLPVPATPKFHPGLPETPAQIKRAAGGVVPKFEQSRPVRIARSTIRTVPTRSSSSSIIATDSKEEKTAVALTGKTKRAPTTANPFQDVGVVSMELSNGRTVDLDITKSPTTAISALDLGVDALKEVKQKMQTYANQLRSFFTKLKV